MIEREIYSFIQSLDTNIKEIIIISYNISD